MNDTENPFHPPTESGHTSTAWAINWRAFWMLNIGLVVALAAIILVGFAWFKYDQMQLQQLPRRYATYGHEITHHVYPVRGLMVLFFIFAIPNIIFFASQLIRRLPVRQSPISSD